MQTCNKFNKASAQAGFTLIEVALALLVLGIGMLSMLAVFPAGLTAGRNAANDSAAIEFSDAIFNDYQWQIDGVNAGEPFVYSSSSSLVSSQTRSFYPASRNLSNDGNWVTVYQDTPTGQFPAFEVLLEESNEGTNVQTLSDLVRVDLYFIKPNSPAQQKAEAFQVFSRYFTYYRYGQN